MAGVFTALFGLARHWPPQPGDVRTVFTFAAVLLPAAGEVRTCLGRRLHTVLLRIHRRLVPLPIPTTLSSLYPFTLPPDGNGGRLGQNGSDKAHRGAQN